jgi:hypothetical protein
LRSPGQRDRDWTGLKAWSDSQVEGDRALLIPAEKLSAPQRLLLRSASDHKKLVTAIARPTDTGFDGQLNPALAASLGAAAEAARCDIDYSSLRWLDLVRHGKGGLLATGAALLGFLFALALAAAGLATSKLPLGYAIALLVFGVLAAGVKLAVDLRALKI